ncbi:MAG: hypothetical protein Kow00124_16840 [Anaerolineae bacterium]
MRLRTTAVLILLAGLLLAGCTLSGPAPDVVVPEEPRPSEIPGSQDVTAIPAMTITVSSTDPKVGDQVTISGQLSSLGMPQYTLTLVTPNLEGRPADTFTLAAGQMLNPAPAAEGAPFALVSATADATTVTFVLEALRPATVTATLSANGEARGPDGSFMPGTAQSGTLAITISEAGLPTSTARLDIEVSHEAINLRDLIGITVSNPEGASLDTYTLTLTGADAADSGLPHTVIVRLGEVLPEEPPAEGARFRLIQASADPDGAFFALQALAPGTFTATAAATADIAPVSGASAAVTFTVSETTSASPLGISADRAIALPGEQITLSVSSDEGLDFSSYTLYLEAAGIAPEAVAEFVARPGQAEPELYPVEGAPFELVSAAADPTGAVFVLRAVQPGAVIASVSAYRDTVSQAGLGPQVYGESAPLNLFVSLYADRAVVPLTLAASTQAAAPGEEVTVTVSSQPAFGFSRYDLLVFSGDDPAAGLRLTARLDGTFEVGQAAESALYEAVSGSATPDGAAFTLRALLGGEVSLQALAAVDDGSLAGESAVLTLNAPVEEAGEQPAEGEDEEEAAAEPAAGEEAAAGEEQAADAAGETEQPAGAAVQYTVQPGDTLYRIGLRFGVDWQIIAGANGLSAPYRLTVGQVLTIPGREGYVVKEGDYLLGIARALGVDWRELARVNSLSAPYTVYPGQMLVVPGP